MLIGRTYRDFQQFDRARAALQRALKMNPRVGRAHYYLGTSAILEEGVVRLDEAIAEFKQELKITPDDPLATLRLGVVLVEARRTPRRGRCSSARSRCRRRRMTPGSISGAAS